MNIKLLHCGSYEYPQTASQYADHGYIVLNLFGLEYTRIYSPAGKLLQALKQPQYPFLQLLPGDFRIDFSYTRERRNWVIIGDIDGIAWVEDSREAAIPYQDGWLKFPLLLPLTMKRALELEVVFDRIGRLLQQQIPVNLFAAEQLAASLLAEFSRDSADGTIPDPASRFKNAIDQDREFRRTLEELNQGSGFSLGHMRRLFVQQFQIDPGEYRARCRLQRILDLFLQTELTPKEIAARVGMRHVTYLHQFLQRHLQLPPGEIRNRYHRMRSD